MSHPSSLKFPFFVVCGNMVLIHKSCFFCYIGVFLEEVWFCEADGDEPALSAHDVSVGSGVTDACEDESMTADAVDDGFDA